jgi:putative copper export protein
VAPGANPQAGLNAAATGMLRTALLEVVVATMVLVVTAVLISLPSPAAAGHPSSSG